MPRLRKGYVAVPVAVMRDSDPDIRYELFDDTRVCAGCYKDAQKQEGVSCKCIVAYDEVIVPEHTVVILKMNPRE